MYKGCAATHSAWPRFLMGGEKGEGPATCWQLSGNFFCGKGEGLEAGDGGNTWLWGREGGRGYK